MFALDHTHYSMWPPVHIRNMMLLSQKHRNVPGEFRAGKIMVHKTNNKFSAMAIDQYHDQKNDIIKGSCVAVGLTDNPPAHGSLMVVGPEVARMIAEFDDDTMTSHQKDSEQHHHEQHPGSISPSNICKRSQSLSAMVEEMGSPFLEDSEDLLVLHTKDNMNVTVWETVRIVEIFGEEQYLRFVNEKLIASDRVCKMYHRTTA